MNRATRIIAATLGVILAISGMNHGFFEILQGNTATNGLVVNAISENYQRWANGNEPAFTLIPNFLISGIAAIIVSVAIFVWCVRFLHTQHGATVFLLLFVLLFLVGGGIGQVVFFTLIWAFATRINKPLTWWRKVLPEDVRRTLASAWPLLLTVSSLLFLLALEIAIFGYFPGVSDADQLLNIVFTSLLGTLIFIVLSFVSGFAYDIQHQPEFKPVRSVSG